MCEFCSKELRKYLNEDFYDQKPDLYNSVRSISVNLTNPNPGTLEIAVKMFHFAKEYNCRGTKDTIIEAKQNFRFSIKYCPFCGRKLN